MALSLYVHSRVLVAQLRRATSNVIVSNTAKYGDGLSVPQQKALLVPRPPGVTFRELLKTLPLNLLLQYHVCPYCKRTTECVREPSAPPPTQPLCSVYLKRVTPL